MSRATCRYENGMWRAWMRKADEAHCRPSPPTGGTSPDRPGLSPASLLPPALRYR